jgi:putative two-component system response regulator
MRFDLRLIKQLRFLAFNLLGLLVLFSGGLFLLSRMTYKKEVVWLLEVEGDVLQQVSVATRECLRHISEDLSLLVNSPEVKEFVERGLQPGEPARKVQDLFLRFVTVHPEFYRMRIIAASGWEVARVNKEKDGSMVTVPPQELQYKGNRHYFPETMKLNKGEFYLSPLDLNIEHGVVEIPYVPVVRLATPLFDSADEKKGILILNIYAESLFYAVSPTKLFILTEGGQRFILSPEGGLQVCEACGSSPHLWAESALQQLQTKETENGLLLYQMIEPWPGWRLVVAKEVPSAPMHALNLRLMLWGTVGFAIVLGLVFAVAAHFLRQIKKLYQVRSAMIHALLLLAGERDQETANHLERVRRYSVLLARELRKDPRYRREITQEFVEDIFLAGPLHDIGKIGVPEAILNKQGPLNDKEWHILKMHVRIGANILERVIEQFGLKDRYLLMAKNICAYHHERYDGTGYLEGLKGEEIPLEARIFAVTDAYDAIRSWRPYKKPLPHEEAVRRIKEEAGRHFDPHVVEAFLRCEEEFRKISETFKDA